MIFNVVFPRHLLASKNLAPKKRMGQNFLADPSTAEMIVRRSGVGPNDVALEVGAGLGALSLPLAGAVKRLYAVEKDSDLIGLLSQVFAENGNENVVLQNADIFDVRLSEMAETEKAPLFVFGNLPYNIASRVIMGLVADRRHVDRAVLMLQREMATRLTARSGTRDYGRLSVMVQYCARVRRLANVAAHLFYPRPKVGSQVIEIDFADAIDEPVVDEGLLEAVVKAAFGRRRKTLKNALANSELAIDADAISRVLSEAGIDPARRAETLSVSEFVALTHAIGRVES